MKGYQADSSAIMLAKISLAVSVENLWKILHVSISRVQDIKSKLMFDLGLLHFVGII